MADRSTSFRTDAVKLERLDRLAEAMDRSRSWLINDALERYLNYEEWFQASVAEGIASLEKGDAISHDDVMAEARKSIAGTSKKKPKR